MRFRDILAVAAVWAFTGGVSFGQTTVQELLDRGVFASRTEGCQAALPLLAEAARLAPQSAEAWFQIGLCEGRTGRQSAKAAAMERALTIRPAYVEARHHLILALRLLGQEQDAAAQIVRLAQHDARLAADLERLFTRPATAARAARWPLNQNLRAAVR